MILGAVVVLAACAALVVPGGRSSGARVPNAMVAARPAVSPCSSYVSSDGRFGGRSQARPTTLARAAARTQPGDVVCLLPGTYRLSDSVYITRSGEPGKSIVYRSYGGTVLIQWSSSRAQDMIQIKPGVRYVAIRGLVIDGANVASQGIKCNQATHLVAAWNVVRNTGGGGISSVGCDYLTVDHNRIFHVGYGVGWASGISFNTSTWSDDYAGFHSFVTNNLISGSVDESSYHSDGNGIIMDLGASVPPVLIANNLVYENGGRCIHNLRVEHIWVINNTCYMNGLDSRLGQVGEITNHDAQDIHLINNIAVAWTDRYPYKIEEGSSVELSRNAAFGGLPSLVPPSAVGTLLQQNPLFVNPLAVDPNADRQYASAVDPALIGDQFRLLPGSRYLAAGVDARTAPGVTPLFRKSIQARLARDLGGMRRWQNGRFALGAFDS